MEPIIRTVLCFALLSAGAAATAAPPAASACLPTIEDGWLRLPPMDMPMLAGFARIANGCAAPAAIVSASSPAFASVELHETRIVDGVSRMRAVPELPIAAGGEAVLRPGGLHLMLMQPRAPLAPGERAELAFTLADGRLVRGIFEVRAATAR